MRNPWAGYDSWKLNGNKHVCGRCNGCWYDVDGGCGCMDDLECKCGNGAWEDYDCSDAELRCGDCGTGPHTSNGTRTSTHTARKDHEGTDIKAGDRYTRTVHLGYYPNGPRTLRATKRKLSGNVIPF